MCLPLEDHVEDEEHHVQDYVSYIKVNLNVAGV